MSTNLVYFYSAFVLEQTNEKYLTELLSVLASLEKKMGHIPSSCELSWCSSLHFSHLKDLTLLHFDKVT